MQDVWYLRHRRSTSEVFMLNILVLCTANSARSILAEALINRIGAGRFAGFSAGSHPRGTPNPDALSLLKDKGYDIASFASKSWDVFAAPGAPVMDIVLTVCDSAAGEICPLWPGVPVKGHWGIPDPAGVGETDEERRAAFDLAYQRLEKRFLVFAQEPVETLSPDERRNLLERIGAAGLQ
jgi:protein-tyrosine-phosphatase